MNKPEQFSADLKEKTPKYSIRFQSLGQEWLGNAKGLCVLLIISFALKISLFFMTDTISNDGPVYINQAIKFLEGSWREAIEIDLTFLYPLLIAAFGRLGFDLVKAGQIVSLVSSVLVLVPLYLLFRGIFNERVAFLGCLALTLSPGMNKFAVAVMRDPFFLLVVAWLVYFAWRVMKEAKIRYFVAISILSVLSPILRVEGLLLVPIIFLMLLFKALSGKRSRKTLLIGAGLLFVLLAFVGLAVVPTTEFSFARHPRVQQIVYSVTKVKESGFFNYNHVLSEKLTDMELSIPGGPLNNNFAKISRNHIGLIYLLGLISLVAQVIWFPFLVVFLFGLPQLLVFGKNSIFLLFFILPYLFIAYLYNINFGFLEERYLYVPVMLMFLGVGIGLDRIFKLFTKLWFSRFSFLFFVIFFFFTPLVQAVREEAKPEAISSRLAGEWLATQPELKESSLIANGRKIPFYAERGGNFVGGGFISISVLKETAINNHIQVVAIEMRKSNLKYLPDFTGYSLLVKFEDPRYVALIYQKNP